MGFIKINYHLNSKFFVEKSAYQDMVTKTLNKIKEIIKINNVEIISNEKNNVFSIKISIAKKESTPFAEISKKIQKDLEEQSQVLTNSKPHNIEVTFEEK